MQCGFVKCHPNQTGDRKTGHLPDSGSDWISFAHANDPPGHSGKVGENRTGDAEIGQIDRRRSGAKSGRNRANGGPTGRGSAALSHAVLRARPRGVRAAAGDRRDKALQGTAEMSSRFAGATTERR
jgi:hypothetical protein